MNSVSTAEEKTTQIRGVSFFFVFGVLFFPMINSFVVDCLLVDMMDVSHIPLWYIVFLFGINILTVFSLVGIYLFKKFCIYLFPTLVMLHFIMHLNYLYTFMYTDIFMLFFFVGIGLVVFIPKWSFFK